MNLHPVAQLTLSIGLCGFLLWQNVEISLLTLAALLIGFSLIQTPIAIIGSLLILAPLRVLLLTEAPSAIPIDVAQGMFVLFVLSVLVETTRRKHGYIPFTFSQPLVLFIPYIIAVTISVVTAWSTGAWLNEWLKWLIVMILIGVIPALSFQLRWQWIVLGLVLAALANAIVGIYTFFGGSGALHLLINGRFFRAFGTFGQPNPFGGYMGMIAPLAIMATFGHGSVLFKRYVVTKQLKLIDWVPFVFYGMASLFIVLALFMSWSRGAWLGFFVSSFIVMIALPNRWYQSLGLMLVLIAFTFVLWSTGLIPTTIADRISSATQEVFVLNDVRAVDITSENYAIVERLAHWQAALTMNQQNFWLGVGSGNYDVAYETVRLINWKESLGHAHNYYLNVLAETGIIGLISYLTALIGIVILTVNARKHPDPIAKAIVLGLLGSWVYIIVHSLTDNLYVNNMFVHFGVMLGILAMLHKETTGVVKD